MTIRLFKVAAAAVGLGVATVGHAVTEAEFSACLSQFQQEAKAQGISAKTVDEAMAGIKLSPRVLELDRQQPEFTTTFKDYFERRVTPQRIEQGRQLLKQHRALLQRVGREYGVPPQYLVAFWGLETNYGSFFGRMAVLDSLATLACDPRRSQYFTRELLAALRIVDEGAVSPAKMEGSWAGAMGHVQFMPSVFLRHALDYDGDGRRDLWGSLPDAMASAANFLRSLGWEEGTRWGREVRLPEEFAFNQTGRSNWQPLEQWRQLGITQADGRPLPAADIQAALLLPAGHRGPAFLVYHNFNVIMRWNQAEFYGLAVGHLADRIAGLGGLNTAIPETPRLTREQVVALQQALIARDIEVGSPDGIMGPATRRGISEFQAQEQMIADGFPHAEVLRRLGVRLD